MLYAVVLNAHAALRLGSLFTDHMVVQQGVRVPVWGWAEPGTEVSVTLAKRSATAKAADDGSFMVRLKPVEAGGPYTLTVAAGSDTVSCTDVLSGEVWVCSGQSNMQWPVVESANPTEEIAAARWPSVRMFNVKRDVADTPQDTCVGEWQTATSDHVVYFSAVGYYFARALHKALKVPVGMIHSSWGGTLAEAWTTDKTLRADTILAAMFPRVERLKEERRVYEAAHEKQQAAWEMAVEPFKNDKGVLPERHTDRGNSGVDSGWTRPNTDDADWKSMKLPAPWERAAGLDIDGAVWFRRTVEIPEAWNGTALTLSLGSIDDMDVTYFNGQQVGSTGKEIANFYAHKRVYTVPADLVTPGTATIAVRVFDHWGGGGIAGRDAGLLSLNAVDGDKKDAISLAGAWKYRVEYALPPLMPPALRRGISPQNEPSVLYNAMVNPLVPYAITGVIWYQGESNASRAYQYRTLLPAMIRDWRTAWGQGDFPFGIVQLANFMERLDQPAPSQWAELREAQLMTAEADENTGMVVIIDIGEADNIHPKNKQEVGRRLSLWAQGAAYGKDVVYTSPVYESAKTVDGKVELTFSGVGSGLVARSGDSLTGFAVAGPDSQFVWADAKVVGTDKVLVWSDSVDLPLSVRYAWADNPACNLYNKEGLPASPFRTDDWPGETVENR